MQGVFLKMRSAHLFCLRVKALLIMRGEEHGTGEEASSVRRMMAEVSQGGQMSKAAESIGSGGDGEPGESSTWAALSVQYLCTINFSD
ncbi:hypothetical protein LEMLEM_LOCUS12204 [Lemmus lemmus]